MHHAEVVVFVHLCLNSRDKFKKNIIIVEFKNEGNKSIYNSVVRIFKTFENLLGFSLLIFKQ